MGVIGFYEGVEEPFCLTIEATQSSLVFVVNDTIMNLVDSINLSTEQ